MGRVVFNLTLFIEQGYSLEEPRRNICCVNIVQLPSTAASKLASRGSLYHCKKTIVSKYQSDISSVVKPVSKDMPYLGPQNLPYTL